MYCLSYRASLCPIGNVYISDYVNHRVRKITITTGIINSIAGTGASGYGGDGGAATSATLNQPYGLGVDSSGFQFIIKLKLFCYIYSLSRQRVRR